MLGRGNRRALKPRDGCPLHPALKEEITADLMHIGPVLMIQGKQPENQNGKKNWIKENQPKQEIQLKTFALLEELLQH